MREGTGSARGAGGAAEGLAAARGRRASSSGGGPASLFGLPAGTHMWSSSDSQCPRGRAD